MLSPSQLLGSKLTDHQSRAVGKISTIDSQGYLPTGVEVGT